MTVPIFLVIQGGKVTAAEICSSEEALQEKFEEENRARGRETNNEEVEAGIVELEDETLQIITPMSDYQQLVNSFDELPVTWLPGMLNCLVVSAIRREVFAEPAGLVRTVQKTVDISVAAMQLLKAGD